MYTALQLIKEEVKTARETFESTLSDVIETQVHADPGGKALPVGALYAHLILSEDLTVNGFLQKKPALSETTWKDKTGLSAQMPAMDENWATAHEQWAKTVQVDLAALREYAKAVYAQTDAYIDTLTDADLEKEVDLGAWGKKTVVHLLTGFVIFHMSQLTGEISAVKGVLGAKGYPF